MPKSTLGKTSEKTLENSFEKLRSLGWNESLEKEWIALSGRQTHWEPARVVAVHRTVTEVAFAEGTTAAIALGKLPPLAVGDWVVLERPAQGNDGAVIMDLFPRRGVLSRNAAGRALRSQILGAHVDRVVVVMALGQDFNPSRLERFLVAARGATQDVVVLLTKSDLVDEGERAILLADLRTRMGAAVPVSLVSVYEREGLEHLESIFPAGKTAVLLGASGVGKTTLTNLLLGGAELRTQEVGEVKDKGRHTTTHRELHLCPGGALLLDSPGIRELQLEDTEEAISSVFEDVEGLIRQCRYSDCGHGNEPGCAVMAAIREGSLLEGRWRSFEKMRREARFQENRVNVKAAVEERKRWKSINVDMRNRKKFEERNRR